MITLEETIRHLEHFHDQCRSSETIARMDDLGFVPTSTHPRWWGKYRCKFCKSTGYPGETNPIWWGHRHGLNCRKK